MCHYAEQPEEKEANQCSGDAASFVAKNAKPHESSVFCHDKDRRAVTNCIVALQSPAECNGEPLRGMSMKMTRLSKKIRNTNMWILFKVIIEPYCEV